MSAMMRLAIVILFCAYAVNGDVLSGLQPFRAKREAPKDCASGRQGCGDCNTVNICSYDGSLVAKYRCKDVDPSKPYCVDGGVCSATPLSNGGLCLDVSDLCPTDVAGYYPDPTNCSRYVYCDSSMLGFEMDCAATNNVYNHSDGACFLKKRSADCFQVDCTRNKDKWFVYTPSPELYFLCSADGPIMFQCARKHYVFDVNLKRCEFQCPSAGRFEHPTNPKMYFECAYVSTSKLQLFEETCPSILVFDPATKKCTTSIQ